MNSTGINIFSGTRGLGAALTNPTTIAYRKGALTRHYPVVFCGVNYADAESAYQSNKIAGNIEFNDLLMTWIVATKLQQHIDLAKAIRDRGGVEFIKACTHHTNAKTYSAQKWEGAGLESRFIRNLLDAYQLLLSGKKIVGADGYEDIYAAAGVEKPEDQEL